MSFRKIFIKICHFIIRSLYIIKLGSCILSNRVNLLAVQKSTPLAKQKNTTVPTLLQTRIQIILMQSQMWSGSAGRQNSTPSLLIPSLLCADQYQHVEDHQSSYFAHKYIIWKLTDSKKNPTLPGPGLREIISSQLCRWESDQIFPTRTTWTRILWKPRKSSKEGISSLDTLLDSISNYLYRREIHHVGHWEIVQPANAKMLL